MKINYKIKSTISMKQFISEFGQDFSDHVKEKLMELESRSFLTRKEINNRVDVKHVEHIQYECACDSEKDSDSEKKEYSYGQFVVIGGELFFSENCLENSQVMQSPNVSRIYEALSGEGAVFENGSNLKKINDSNIDFVIDNILDACPEVSKEYMAIVKGMVSRAKDKGTEPAKRW